MKFTRKEFLKTGALIAGGVLIQGNKFFYSEPQKTLGLITIRDNFGIYIERGGTIGWYAAKDAVVVIDSQFPETVNKFITELQKKTTRKIDLFFNTHHHADHTGGNVYIKDFAKKMIAHENCVALQKKSYGNNPGTQQVYADTTFADEWKQKIGKETVVAKYFGPAHTGGDAVIHFEKANIAHAGDLVFNKTYPYIDANGGGSVASWIETLEKVIKYYSKDTLFIFGHGATSDLVTGSLGDVVAMKNLLSALVDFVSKGIKDGKNKIEISLSTDIPGTDGWKERVAGMLRIALEKVYDELIKK
ncbi:MAG: MBL fold metallo-hydrolase [Melioribacter sp.]|nr:MBL fold metallo-hydrolase [Melioribacter sp.]